MENDTFQNDVNGKRINEGDEVVLLNAPEELLKGLPTEDQIAIKGQVGKPLIVQGFDAYGNAELEFQSNDEHYHTIWVKPLHLKKKKP